MGDFSFKPVGWLSPLQPLLGHHVTLAHIGWNPKNSWKAKGTRGFIELHSPSVEVICGHTGIEVYFRNKPFVNNKGEFNAGTSQKSDFWSSFVSIAFGIEMGESFFCLSSKCHELFLWVAHNLSWKVVLLYFCLTESIGTHVLFEELGNEPQLGLLL